MDWGIVVSPNVKPGILCVHGKVEDMIANDIFVKDEHEDIPAMGTWWGGKGYFADFTKENTRVYWRSRMEKTIYFLMDAIAFGTIIASMTAL